MIYLQRQPLPRSQNNIKKMELIRVDTKETKSDVPFKVFFATTADHNNSENESLGVNSNFGNVTYTVGRGPLLQITDSKISRLVILNTSFLILHPSHFTHRSHKFRVSFLLNL